MMQTAGSPKTDANGGYFAKIDPATPDVYHQTNSDDDGPRCATCKAKLDRKSHDLLEGENCAFPASCRFAIRAAVTKSLTRPKQDLEDQRLAVRKVDGADAINPAHYTQHPSGVECIKITEHMGFCLGNAVKYIWRADLKHDAFEDLQKARWYIDRELERRKATEAG